MTITEVTVVQDNPNPSVATFDINADLLGGFGEMMIPRTSKAVKYSGLANEFFERSGASRIDFAFQSNGHTRISLFNKATEWPQESIERARKGITDFLESGRSVIDLEGIAANVPVQKPFQPAGPVEKTVLRVFTQAVNQILEKDGGAIKLLSVTTSEEGEISAKAALIGSCTGCSSATTDTLADAAKAINTTLDGIKKNNSNNQDLQKLHFTIIEPVDLPEAVFER